MLIIYFGTALYTVAKQKEDDYENSNSEGGKPRFPAFRAL